MVATSLREVFGTCYVALPIRNCVSKLPKFTKKQIEYKNVSENTMREISS